MSALQEMTKFSHMSNSERSRGTRRCVTFSTFRGIHSTSLRSAQDYDCLPCLTNYLEEFGTADIAFEATGRDLPELFRDAADATTNVMIDNIEAIQPRETRQIELSNDNSTCCCSISCRS